MAVTRRRPIARIALPQGRRVTVPQPKLPKSVTAALTSPKPVTPPAPPAAPPAPAAPPVPPAHDASYLSGVGKLDFQKTQGISQLQQQQAYDETDFNETLRRLASAHPEQTQSTKETANRQGLFYSGQLDKRLYGEGGVETLYQRQVADQQRDFQRRTAARSAAQQALEQGYPLDVASLAAEEADRRVARDQANPPPVDQGSAAAAPPPPAATVKTPSRTMPITANTISGRTLPSRRAKVTEPIKKTKDLPKPKRRR